MAIWVPEYLSKNTTESSSDQTLYIDLPKNEQISFLGLELSAQGSATPRTTTTLIDDITDYQVVADGSKVLFSLEPELAYYVHFITRGGEYAPLWPNYTPNARCGHEFIIPFGRYMFDEEYMLDTSLYNSVQLRIPYNINNARWTASTFRHNIVMYRPLEKLRPVGFIRSRTVKKETSAGAVETINHALPMTYPLRYVWARFEDLDANIATDVTAMKVNIDEGRLILADLNINEWRDQDKRRWPRKTGYWVTFALTDGTYVKAHTDYPYPESFLSSAVRAFMVKLSAAAGEQVAMNIYEEDGSAASGGHAYSILVSGPNPHKCMTLIDGRKEPFDVTRYSQGKVEYTLAAYTTILHTCVQEVVTGRL